MTDLDHISICICTYRRLQTLERLIKKLLVQETQGLFNYSIIVVDNDIAGSSRVLIENINKNITDKIHYDIEPERSIPAARNRALSLADGNYIAIIDDDEFPPPHWLVTLYKAIQTFDVDGALGPVIPYFEQRPPSWLIKGKFCERPIYRTGTLLEWHHTRTGNVLLRRKVFEEHNLKFDLKWKTSGSDRAFFKKAIELGYKFVAVAEAPVYEIVPPERWAKSYYIKRALVHGYNTYRNSIKGTSFLWQFITAFKSAMALGAYLIIFPFSLVLGPAWYLKCLEKGAHHLSQLVARFGLEIIKKRDF
ncbi:MAG: glycosyltransferase family 2 protein [Candidatus Aminicenantes bacterium]|nr:glycosyltransferase family 2 protein [Candidatus Aminicenantes bacterium]